MAVEDKGDDCPEGTPICTRVRADDSAGNLRRQLGVNAKSKPGKPGLHLLTSPCSWSSGPDPRSFRSWSCEIPRA